MEKIKSEDIDRVLGGGEMAGKFNPETIVYSEMAVRVIIYNALCHCRDRLLTSQCSRPEKPGG